MRRWWHHRSLKLRLTLWYAGATLFVVALFALIVFEIVEHRLASEIDRQLRIDFDLIEAKLDGDEHGGVHWLVQGAHGDEGFARLSAWFEVWSEEKELLLRHWPVPEAKIKQSLPAPVEPALRFATVELEQGLHVRVMERPARVHTRGVIVRVFRDETDVRRTLHDIGEVFLLVAPLAATLAAIGGYIVARRSLRPIETMAARAREITSASLGQRLPVANPHDELGKLATVFNETLRRLEESFTELHRFTADASHELRTPLTALRAVGEDALRKADHPAIGSILEEAQRLEDLIESLLALARIEGDQFQLTVSPVQLDELVLEVREMLRVLAADKDQCIEIAGIAPPSVPVDRLLTRQAITNVLHNAIRYSSTGSRILVSFEVSVDSVTVCVADDGPGIAPEFHERIFDRFYRVDRARSRADGGHGLGLAIAKLSVERQGGAVEVESEIGRGSRFRLRFLR